MELGFAKQCINLRQGAWLELVFLCGPDKRGVYPDRTGVRTGICNATYRASSQALNCSMEASITGGYYGGAEILFILVNLVSLVSVVSLVSLVSFGSTWMK